MKDHINRLQDKIFCIQREDELELFRTVERLEKEYKDGLEELNRDQDRVRESFAMKIEEL